MKRSRVSPFKLVFDISFISNYRFTTFNLYLACYSMHLQLLFITGVECVFHTASPVTFENLSDPKAQLIDCAVEGTKNVLSSIENNNKINCLVLTSSVAAVIDQEHLEGTLPFNSYMRNSLVCHLPEDRRYFLHFYSSVI